MKPVNAYLLSIALFEFGMAFTITTYTPYLQSIGLGFSDVSIINFWFWVAILLCELPSGIFADRVSRLASVRIGLAFVILGSAFYAFAYDFFTALVDEILIGIGFACISGALSAWIKDTILDDKAYAKTIATGAFIRSLALTVGGFIGGMIAAYNYRLSWLFAAVIVLMALVVNLKFTREEQKKSDIATSTLRMSWRILWSKPALLWVVIASMVFGLVLPYNHYWTSFFLSHVGQVGLAWIWIPMFGASAVGGLFIRRYIHRHEIGMFGIALSIFISGASLLFIGLVPGTFFPLGIVMMHEFARGVFFPLLETFTQHRVESAYRATYGSLQSFITRFGYIAVLFWAWWYMRDLPSSEASIVKVWVIAGSLLAVFAVLLWFFRPKEQLA